ncbi:MAG: SURF1 family protein [Hyphomicrobiales bacterium]|nr:SURF1 family protein [Hyphomicrobiales bacterium]
MSTVTTRSLRGLLSPTIAAVYAFAVLIGLGWWQVERLAWKLALIERFDKAVNAAPIELNRVIAVAGAGENVAFRPLFFRVSPLSEDELHLYTAVRGEAGWRVIVAVRTDSGAVLILDRGFVPEAMKNAARPPLEAQTRFIGRVELPETQELFTPDNEPQRNNWYWRDLKAMARALGQGHAALVPFYVLLESPAPAGGWPRPEAVPEPPRNPHLGYALTWFGLAAALAGVYMAFVLKTLRTAP